MSSLPEDEKPQREKGTATSAVPAEPDLKPTLQLHVATCMFKEKPTERPPSQPTEQLHSIDNWNKNSAEAWP